MVVQSQFWDNSKWLERLPFKLDLTHPFWRQVLFRQHFVSSSLGQLGQQTSSSTIPINCINTVNDIQYFWCLKPCQTPHFEYDGCIPFIIYIYNIDPGQKDVPLKDIFLESASNLGTSGTIWEPRTRWHTNPSPFWCTCCPLEMWSPTMCVRWSICTASLGME